MKSCLISKAAIPTSTSRFLPGLLPRSRASPFTSAIFARNVGGRSMSSSSEPPTHRVFHLRLDPLTGNSELIVVNEEEVEAKNPNDANSLLAATSYLDMLNDSRRNRAFYQAIKKTITKPCHVLDIGAGTGLLSMMAAQALIECGGGEGSVSACEAYLPMGKLMRKVLRENGLEKKIRIFHKRSDELEVGIDLTSRADVLVSEILDSELLGEGLIPTLQHAHDLLLVENAQTVPHRATTYGQLVESTFLGKLNDLYSSEVIASDGVRLVPSGLERIVCTKSKHYAMDCNAIAKTTRLLSEPFKIFEFDFWKRPDSQGETELHLNATDDGTVHAVISWWVLQLDAQGSIYYSTAPNWINFINTHKVPAHIPGAKEWCDHWKQCVWFIPGIGMPVSKDQRVLFQATHNGTSISYCLRNDRQIKEVAFGGLGTGDCQLMLLPERIGIYGEKEWRSTWLTAAKYALQGKSSLLCVVADDSAFLTIAIARFSKNSHIISSFPGLREKGARYVQAIADANSFSMDNVKVLGKRTSCLTMDDLNQRKVDLLIGEPFYCGSEGILPWHNLRFWYERTSVDSILADDAIIMPCKGILKACAMSLPDLWRSRCCLKKIEGFDHSCVNETLGACGNLPPTHEGPCLPYFIWQCGNSKELSEVFSIMEFNFLDRIHQCSGKAKVGFTRPGVCHGFVLWIDWVIDERNSIAISTGPDRKYWKQGVKLLSKPVEVNLSGSCKAGECCSTEIEAFFDPSNGELDIKSSFTI